MALVTTMLSTIIGGAETFTSITISGLTASRAVVTDANKTLASSATTATELGYVNGVTSAIQTQINAKLTGTAASQTDQETGTSTTAFVASGTQKFHPSASKAWASFTGTGTPALNASYNVTSITDDLAGQWTLNFTVAFSSANFSAVATGDNSIASAGVLILSTATGTVTIRGVRWTDNSNQDLTTIYVACFGDQ